LHAFKTTVTFYDSDGRIPLHHRYHRQNDFGADGSITSISMMGRMLRRHHYFISQVPLVFTAAM
jgi:hypothetical protein